MNIFEKKHEIYLAGGCFWGMQGYFRQLNGILNTEVGYANGDGTSTDYSKVKQTGHAETLKIIYNSNLIHLAEILAHYFKIIDPFSINRQGNDIGTQYRTGIYYIDELDKPIIETSLEYIKEKFLKNPAVEYARLTNFIKAEDYHQDYLVKNPDGYCHINIHKATVPLFSDKDYPKPDNDILKRKLDPLSYCITREAQTEAPFTSPLLKKDEPGIYVDITNGQPLFSSVDKFDAGCGWPSFSKTIVNWATDYHKDCSHGMIRTEVTGSISESHLGHVFNDGPESMGGLRFCINGAAIAFIPRYEMKAKGYAQFIPFTYPQN